MMKIPTKFITDWPPEEIAELIENHQAHPNFHVRNRSHAVLLSHQGYPIDEIAQICRVDRDTVSNWLNLWNESKLAGLADEARSGRPRTLTPPQEEQAVSIALQNPRFPKRQINQIVVATGKQISELTPDAVAQKKDFLWKRIKVGLWQRANETEKMIARQELEQLNEQADQGEIDLIYFDQSGFNLCAKVVYAWQKRGERITVPVTKSKLQNV